MSKRRGPFGIAGAPINETNELFRVMRQEVQEHRDKQEPTRIAQMLESCARLGVALRKLDDYRYRLTKDEKSVDYFPRTRRVVSTASVLLDGRGLRFALEQLGIARRDSE
jgi:hypothetical protein